jgi:hypothetical protein
MRNGRIAITIAVAVAALSASVAQAGGSFTAKARRPAYDSSSLQLVGTGAYRTRAAHPGLQVTVCLRKRFGRRFFDVRCATATGKGRRIVGQVSVPGCVPGAWRTTTVGEALNRRGAWVHQASAVSRPFRC